MPLTVTVMDYGTGQEADVPANEAIAQDVLAYLFKFRSQRRPWLDDPEGFDRRVRYWKQRIASTSAVPIDRPRRSWEEEAWLLRQPGAMQLSWAQTAANVGKAIGTVRAGVARIEKQKAEVAPAEVAA